MTSEHKIEHARPGLIGTAYIKAPVHPHPSQGVPTPRYGAVWPPDYSSLDESLVTDLVPSGMRCLDVSPERTRRTYVYNSRNETVVFLLYEASFEASETTRSKMLLTKMFRMGITTAHTDVLVDCS